MKKLISLSSLLGLFALPVYASFAISEEASPPTVTVLAQDMDSVQYEFRWTPAINSTGYQLQFGPDDGTWVSGIETIHPVVVDTVWVQLDYDIRTYFACVMGFNRRGSQVRSGEPRCVTFETPAPVLAEPGIPGPPVPTLLP